MSSWGDKLQGKLANLQEHSSKESIQTVAKWIGFNRKHAAAFSPVWQQAWDTKAINNGNTNMQKQYLTLTHEVLQLEKDTRQQTITSKWDRLLDLRLVVGEQVLLPRIAFLGPAAMDLLQIYIKDWDSINAFGVPTLIQQMRKQMEAGKTKNNNKDVNNNNISNDNTANQPAENKDNSANDSVLASNESTVVAEPSGDNGDENNKDANVVGEEISRSMSAANVIQGSNIDSIVLPAASAATGNSTSPTQPEPSVTTEQTTENTTDLPSNSQTSHDKATNKINNLEDDTSLYDDAIPRSSDHSDVLDVTKNSSNFDAKMSSKNTNKTNQEAIFDFESTGIPYNPKAFDIKSLTEPCRVIASLQISRELRNDSGVQLSSLLSALPQDIRKACAEAAELSADDDKDGGEKEAFDFTIDEATARDFERRTDPALMERDLDLDLQSIRDFRSIVERQRAARKALIYALIQTRCKFGADEAARAFFQADRAMSDYKRREQILLDGMELEGLIGEEDKTKKVEVKQLPPLTWYKDDDDDASIDDDLYGDNDSDVPPAKRTKTT